MSDRTTRDLLLPTAARKGGRIGAPSRLQTARLLGLPLLLSRP